MIVRFYMGRKPLLETRMVAPPGPSEVVMIGPVAGRVVSRVWHVGIDGNDVEVMIMLARQKGIAKAMRREKGEGKGP